MDIRLGTLLLFLAGSTCAASDRVLVAQPAANQSMEYKSGSPYIVSSAGNTIVVFAPNIDSKSQATLWFTVRNMGPTPITVFDGAVTAISNGESLRILGAADLEKKDKRKKFWENLGAGLAAGANSYTAAQSGHSTARSDHYGRADAYTRDGSIQIAYQGTTTTQTYDPEANRRAVADANSRNAQMLASIRATQAARSAALESNVLQTQTVGSGEAYSGFVQMRLPRVNRSTPSMIDVTFTVGPDRHNFFIFLDGQPTQFQSAKINQNARSSPSSDTVTTSATQVARIANPQPRKQTTNPQIESLESADDNWSADAIAEVNDNWINQLVGGREVEEKSRTQFAFACMCMTDRLKEEVSYDALISASELSLEEQQSAKVNMLARKRLKECAREYYISLK